MTWTDKQILDALRMIEASDYDEVRIETGDFKLHVRRNGAPAAPGAGHVPAATMAPSPVTPQSPTIVNDPVSPVPPPVSSVAAAEPAEGVTVVRAPMIGTFYRAPSPQSPPFVEAGARVKRGDTLCLIEVMKLFNTIKADADGRIVRILAQNAASVRKDQPLFWIEADA